MAQERRLPEDSDRFERETVQRATVGFPLPDGSKVEIPLTRVFGRCPEPRVVIVAGVHGDELVGPHALVELAQELVAQRVARYRGVGTERKSSSPSLPDCARPRMMIST